MRNGAPIPPKAGAIDPELPEVGCYRVFLRRGAPASGVRIWHGFPIDPESLQPMEERPLAWQAELNGFAECVWRFWPACAREPIGRFEYERLSLRNSTHDDSSPFFDVSRPVDFGRAAPVF